MNRFSEVMTVESSPLTLRLPKELLHVPVKVTVEQAIPPVPALRGRRPKVCFTEFIERPVKIARLKRFTKDELHER